MYRYIVSALIGNMALLENTVPFKVKLWLPSPLLLPQHPWWAMHSQLVRPAHSVSPGPGQYLQVSHNSPLPQARQVYRHSYETGIIMSKCNISTRILGVSNEVAQVMTSVLTHELRCICYYQLLCSWYSTQTTHRQFLNILYSGGIQVMLLKAKS